MPTRSLAVVLIVLFSLSGCTVKKVQKLPPTAVIQPAKDTIIGATTLKAEDVRFDPPGASLLNGTLHGSVNKAAYDLPMDQVRRLWVQREGVSTGRTIGLVA